MKIRNLLTVAALSALAACGSDNQANNAADLNSTTDVNAGMTDLNATDMNGSDLNAASDMNGGTTDLNAAGAGAGAAGTTNAMGNINSTAPPPGTH
jgi:hypothetical protein